MNLTAAAAYLGVSSKTLRLEAERGAVAATRPLQEGSTRFALTVAVAVVAP